MRLPKPWAIMTDHLDPANQALEPTPDSLRDSSSLTSSLQSVTTLVLLWSITARGKRQIFCTTRSGSYVVVLGFAVEGGHDIGELQSWLIRIAGSLHAIS